MGGKGKDKDYKEQQIAAPSGNGSFKRFHNHLHTLQVRYVVSCVDKYSQCR